MALADVLKAEVEKLLKAAVEANSDMLVDKAFEALEKAIPGQIDDAILEAAKPSAKVAIKEALLKLVDQISDQV